jgi:hypothetical protein
MREWLRVRPDIKWIVSTEDITLRRGRVTPVGWNYERVVIEHKLVGGVSSARFGVHYWIRFHSQGSVLQPSSVPSQDLRSV